MSLNTIISFELMKTLINESISRDRSVPDFNLRAVKANESLNTILNFNNLPNIEYKSKSNSVDYNNNISDILTAISALSINIEKTRSDYAKLSSLYESIYSRIKKINKKTLFELNRLLGYSCINISTDNSNTDDRSNIGLIGNLLTLPFNIASTTIFEGPVDIYAVSTSSIDFSNVDKIAKLPLDDNINLKISDSSQTINLSLNISFSDLKSNAFYVKFENDISNIELKAYLGDTLVVSQSFSDGEILANYDTTTINSISLNITISNTNPDKPYSLRIDDMILFNNIKFAKSGTFISKQQDLDKATDVNLMAISYLQSGLSPDIATSQLISISANEAINNFIQVDKDYNVDISLYKYKYSKVLDNTTTGTYFGRSYSEKAITDSDIAWEIYYKNATLLYMANEDFYKSEKSISDRYKSWTLSDNYYKAFVLNYYDTFIDIGSKKCLINNKEYTGLIKIPFGINEIAIHIKDCNILDDIFSNDAKNKENLLLRICGLPSFNSIGAILTTSENFAVKSRMAIISTQSPFLPFSETVQDEFGNFYSLALNKAPMQEGFYTIDPYSGTINVYTFENVKQVMISYINADKNNKPVGLFFNRPMQYIPSHFLSEITDNSFFSMSGDSITKTIIYPSTIESTNNSYILFNNNQDKIFVSSKIDLSTKNQNLTPVISSIAISVN